MIRGDRGRRAATRRHPVAWAQRATRTNATFSLGGFALNFCVTLVTTLMIYERIKEVAG